MELWFLVIVLFAGSDPVGGKILALTPDQDCPTAKVAVEAEAKAKGLDIEARCVSLTHKAPLFKKERDS